jgi:hypothetical protein
MHYILLIYGDEAAWAAMSPDQLQRCYADHGAYSEAMTRAGVLRGGAELTPGSTAVTLRFTGGRPTATDGPFAETREQLGGYYLIEVDSLEAAQAWAAKMPCMDSGAVEIRPLGMGA